MQALSNAEHQKHYRQRRNERAHWADTIGKALEATINTFPADPVLREQLGLKLDSSWRRQKAEEYPGDLRNLEAVELLDKLAREFDQLEEDHVLLKAYSALWQGEETANLAEAESEYFRQLGVRASYDNVTETLCDLIMHLTAELEEGR